MMIRVLTGAALIDLIVVCLAAKQIHLVRLFLVLLIRVTHGKERYVSYVRN